MAARKKASSRKKKTVRKAVKKKATRKTAKKPARKKAARKTAKKPARKKATRKTAKKSARKSAGKPVRKAARKPAKKKRKANAAFMAPVQPDEALAAVVGGRAIPRTQVVKKLWSYIKRNDLQDAKNRRVINADAKLKPVFGGRKKVNMFEMTKLVSNHLS